MLQECRELSFQNVIHHLSQLRNKMQEKKKTENKNEKEFSKFSKKTHSYSDSNESIKNDIITEKNDNFDSSESLLPLIKFDSMSETSSSETFESSCNHFEFTDQNGSVILSHNYDILGKGAYSEVYRGTLYIKKYDKEKYNVAVKVIKIKLYDIDELERWIHIISIWKYIIHPCFIHCYYVGLFIPDNEENDINIYAALELASCGTLDSLLKKNEKLNEDLIKIILSDILITLCYLHNEVGVVHNDIKPQNILIFKDDKNQCIKYKLSDLDALCPVSKTKITENIGELIIPNKDLFKIDKKLFGTPLYMSPESCRGFSFLTSNDIWSIGILLYQLSTGRLPWGILELQIPAMILHGYRQDNSINSFGPTLEEFDQDINNIYSNELKQVVRACLVSKANERPSVLTLLQYPFFSKRA